MTVYIVTWVEFVGLDKKPKGMIGGVFRKDWEAEDCRKDMQRDLEERKATYTDLRIATLNVWD